MEVPACIDWLMFKLFGLKMFDSAVMTTKEMQTMASTASAVINFQTIITRVPIITPSEIVKISSNIAMDERIFDFSRSTAYMATADQPTEAHRLMHALNVAYFVDSYVSTVDNSTANKMMAASMLSRSVR